MKKLTKKAANKMVSAKMTGKIGSAYSHSYEFRHVNGLDISDDQYQAAFDAFHYSPKNEGKVAIVDAILKAVNA